MKPVPALSIIFFSFLLLPTFSNAALCPKDTVCLMPPELAPVAREPIKPSETTAAKTTPTSFYCIGVTSHPIVGAAYWNDLLVEVAKAKGLKPEWLCTLLKQESGGKIAAVGRDGECGAFQIMPFHFRNRGGPYPYNYYAKIEDGRGDARSCFNPRNNLEVAASLFKNHYYKACNKNLLCAFARYNGSGPRAEAYAQRAMRTLEGIA